VSQELRETNEKIFIRTVVASGIIYWFGFVVSFYYLVDVCIRLKILGWVSFIKRHPQSPVHRLDLALVAGLLTAEFIVLVNPAAVNSSTATRALVLVRASRALRLLWFVPQIRETLTILLSVIMALANFAEILFVVFLIYAIVGVQIFGGLINTEADQFQGTDFGTSTGGYWAVNMNDTSSAIVLLFCLMIGNNFQVTTHGLILALAEPNARRPGSIVDPSGVIASAFAASFYIITNFCALNVLCALTIDAFATLKDSSGDNKLLVEAQRLSLTSTQLLAEVFKTEEEEEDDLEDEKQDEPVQKEVSRQSRRRVRSLS